ncbi:MAG TPA: arginine repressor [Candidatus Baltobacteraceae bacterium]|jgi:transcriptional regulator of arginine metabolism|nr:arginine repressor [Candidatus Baltobacteraceae bacterium]
MKERRQRAILTLVATRPIHSQDELVTLLQRQRFDVTQATISRDIKELGLVKVPIKSERGDEIFKYVVPSAAVNYVSRLHRAMSELVTSVDGSVNLIVLRTPPATAMPVASAIDEAAWPEILGTIGGDDTILVILRSATDMPILKQRFLDLKGTQAA